ncbi:glutamine synthetase [Cyanobium sp. LEGE 06143]|nr:glutamine synthetase [Cyanobium sp. LEGE 06143]
MSGSGSETSGDITGGAVRGPGAIPAQGLEPAAQAADLLPNLLEQGLRRLAITFVTHGGAVLAKGVPVQRLVQVARAGVGFSPVSDAFGATGAIDPLQSLARPDGDLRLVPDLSSLRALDLTSGWAWAAGERRGLDGQPYALDQRSFCRRWQQTLSHQGLETLAGFEIEWMVGRTSPDGAWRPAVPGGPYGADRLVEGLDYLAALAEALDGASLDWLQLHPEYGAGQFELSLAPATPLEAADRLVAARLLIQRVSERFGWRCSFSPLVSPELVGNGGHLHLSLQRQGRHLLGGGPGVAGLTREGEALVAGLLQELPALLPLACALGVSYRRLAPGRWAAPFQVWGVENREAALRLIPASAAGEPAHLELKVSDLSANPYLLLGAVMAVVEASLQTPRPLPAPVSGDPGRKDGGTAPRLPLDLAAATAAFEASALLRQALGERLHSTVAEARHAEIRRCEGMEDQALIASTCCWPVVG